MTFKYYSRGVKLNLPSPIYYSKIDVKIFNLQVNNNAT